MTVAIAVAVPLLIGLPLLAWWVARRPVWTVQAVQYSEARKRQRAVVLRYQLTTAEQADVERAVTGGRGLTDPRLRAAVVDWAQVSCDAAHRRPALRSGLVLLVLAWGLLLLGLGVVGLVSGDWSRTWWLNLLQWGTFATFVLLRRRAPYRAIARNSGPVTGGAVPPGAMPPSAAPPVAQRE
ncbi:hypothetical protein [uncultured Modestobacter sp.]|uniref:hypothetical protein n=1 Tax=uncultured Modestobacter sp. TaxID=380048 RepID=UPI00263443BD|nr:hypothetical protein [uncultured Modestobacter sp.]